MNPKYRVLIAEDDHQIAEIQRRFVDRIDGFEVVGISHTTRDAKDMSEVFKPDLVLLDIHFPDGNGLDLLKALRSDNAGCDVIMITAAKEVDSLSEALRLGVFDYVLKPLVFNRLEQALKNYAQHRKTLLQTHAELSQQAVDQLIPRNRQSSSYILAEVQQLPKGIDKITLEKVRSVFDQGSSSLSAEQVGESIGSSRTTARRYLEYLVGQHLLAADIHYGTVGRPERLYSKS